MEERMGFANYCTEEPILVPMKRMKNEPTNNHEKAPVNGESMDDNSVNFDGIDRISNLPTEIICHILSFLPTKFAVGTCILSTKWKNLFALIPNLRLRLDDTLLLHQEISPGTYLVDFMNFADRLLNVTLRDVPSVKCFTLICDKVDEGQNIANWIHAALRLNIKSLDLHIRQLKNSNLLLDSLFGCSIVSLNLLVNFGVDAPEYRFSLPNLKKLSVHCMKFSPANVLLASCPLLEFLRVNKCYCQPGETLRISLPSLKGLKLISGKNGFEGEFQLDAPNLKYLSYGGFLANRYSSTKLKFLQLAILELDQAVVPYPFDSNEKAVELIKVSAYAEKLRLSEEIVAMLCHYPHPLPKFQKMTALSIQNMDSNGWELLPRFLECAPNLTKLFLKAGFDDESYERFKGSLKEPLPICLSRHHETCIILEIQRKVGKPSSSLPTCRAVRS